MKQSITRGGAAGIALAALLSSLCPAMSATSNVTPDVEWRGYNNDFTGERFSPLDEITPANVASLKPLCQMRLGDAGAFEAGLVMIGDTLYATTGHTTVALDPTNCAERWRHVYVPEQDELLAINRGVAFLDGRLFRGTADGRVIAIDAKTGKELWRVRAADPDQGEEFTAAPIAWNGLVFLGPAVGELGVRGHVFAFDAKTGRQVWRFDTVPVGNEPGADSWKIPATTKHGGGGTWTSYTLDPAQGELFIPVGNPAPDFLPDSRPGENLYTDSVVVLDAKTGALKWYYQLEANDARDWDLGAAPMLYADAQGHRRVALGSKDGFVYVLDRDTHKLLFKTAVTTVGSQDKKPSPKGEHICPGILGGVEWNGPAHSPQTNAIYVGAVDWCWTVASAAPAPFDMKAVKSGAMYVGGTFVPDANVSGWITAIDDRTGAVKWRYHSARPVVAGVTPTAGGVLFAGNLGGSFFAFDAASGKLLKEIPLKDALAGGVVTYRVAGKQYVAVTTGNISRISFGNGGSPAVAIMTAGLPADYAEKTLNVKRTEASMNAGNGKMVFVQFCAACHGTNGASGYASGPDIRNVALDHKALVAWIKNPKAPMPKLFPEELTDKDVEAVATYVQSLGTVHGAAGTRAAPR